MTKDSRYRWTMVIACLAVATATALGVGYYAWKFEQSKKTTNVTTGVEQ